MALPTTAQQKGPWGTGGVNYALPAEDLPADTLFAMQDCRIGRGGQAATRPGNTPYIAAIGGTPTITACGQQVFSASSEATFCIAGAVFYEDVSGTWTDRTAAITITAGDTNTWTWVNAAGTLYATSNSKADAPIKWAAAGGNIANAGVSSRFTQAAHVEFWDNRLWYGNEDTNSDYVWFTDQVNLETITNATDFYLVDQPITGLKALRTALAVHTQDSIHLFFYSGTVDVYIPEKRADIGAISGRSIVVTPNGTMLFVAKDGIYEWAIPSPVQSEVSATPTKISITLEGGRYWDLINADQLENSHAVLYPAENEVWFFLPHGTSQTSNNHVMVWDYVRRIWYGPYLLPRACAALVDRIPHAGGYSDGILYSEATGTNDNGTAIDAWFQTANDPAVDEMTDVRLLYARHFFDVKGDFDVSVRQSGRGLTSNTELFSQGGGQVAIGSFTIGVDAIAPVDLMADADTILQGYAPSAQLRYQSGGLDQPMSIRRVRLAYRGIGMSPDQLTGDG